MGRSALLTWVMVRGDDSDLREFVIQPQGLHYLPSAWPYSYPCSDFRKHVRRFIYINLNVRVLRKGHSAGETPYSAPAEINMRVIRLRVESSTYQIATVNLGVIEPWPGWWYKGIVAGCKQERLRWDDREPSD